ncbi:type II toxin-antitoxin system death-on-curing family toxin [Edwardsiella ictaluri]|uniref:Death on curing family protein n=2 Tax=Edwardsiella ictaluri TaxID=67780 RepID=C5B7U2_EDWI9|nr:type II toxin-antitoxin system death-on-curing family toxin [Edwardsiella ictaluri]ACR68088.1 death on curing family protein [Edwardsiella ictaluri 93-146]AVZ81507.1 type II toxin-antitoxin system death-on-curing family toxin [Edwardsiella ictaluri]EKS7763730.1 type II toxin-antitoxin system death-on-curing family toxin [Edwardsiella ictaluri]EKS7771341.1 type II toxin-antitoxin system death-on-curing family toxin [Edwardsiella ictaluri]EKS7774457.1 type II toxin-antitoxin system death-on-c
MMDAHLVIGIHDFILAHEPGLVGYQDAGRVDATLARVDNRILYEQMNDIFQIAAAYAVSIARGHVFADANKRTALVTALTYLDMQGVNLKRTQKLEDIMVDVAEGTLDLDDLADIFYTLSDVNAS